MCCNKVLDTAANPANLNVHKLSQSHQRAYEAARHQPVINLVFEEAAAAITEERLMSIGALSEDARGLLTIYAARYTAPSNIPSLYAGTAMEVAMKLQKLNKALKDGGMVARAMADGVKLVKNAVKSKLDGQTMCLIVDEATTKFASGQRPMAILLGCSAVGKPILVSMHWGAGDAATAVESIRHVLNEYRVNLETQITCMIGDNVTFNDALASGLGLPRLRCIPHSLQLVFEKIAAPFKRFRTATLGLSRVLTAGGGMKRREALRAAGLLTDRLHCVNTRWNQAQEMARYLAAERTFGVMRNMENSLRLKLKKERVEEELFARVNSWLVDHELARILPAVRKM